MLVKYVHQIEPRKNLACNLVIWTDENELFCQGKFEGLLRIPQKWKSGQSDLVLKNGVNWKGWSLGVSPAVSSLVNY